MPTETQTVTTSSDYRVAAGDWLRFTNQNGFVLDEPATSLPQPTLRISGEVDVIRTAETGGSLGVVGISVVHTFHIAPSVAIDAGASLNVSATLPGGVALGYFANNTGLPFLTNLGAITVIADAAASGVVNIASGGVLNTGGQITVTSVAGDATGVRFGGGGQLMLNHGVITAIGHGQVTGVDMGHTTGQRFINEGTIVARDDSSATTSVGVYWGVGFQQGSSFVNEGRIEGDQALLVEVSYGEAADNLFTNNGVMAGSVWLGGGAAETLVNTGLITGAIRMVGAGSLYDGRLGFALGPIIGSSNGGNTFLGGGRVIKKTGGFRNDTMSGGAGDDLIDGGEGANQLDGGVGLNTLSFASVSNGVQVDLAAGTAHLTTGDDIFTGFAQVVGTAWSDTLRAATGSSVAGGAGDDSITGAANGADYLRGDDGNDSILGGSGFDDANGNMGNDTISTGAGDDWAVGGKDNDFLSGDAGGDVVWGNLGNDTCNGGDGADQVRGGQGDDSVSGGAGDDYVSGDRGNDTISGGTGADLFHGSQDAGIDRVLDFNLTEGDRVFLDPGTTYTLSQVGADTVIDMGGGHQMILVGVQLSTLTPGWIFGA